MSAIGRIIKSDEGCFVWIIDDFLSYAWTNYGRNRTDTVESPFFKFSDFSCRLIIRVQTEGGLGLFFRINDSSDTLHVALGMGTGYKGKIETRSGKAGYDNQFGLHVNGFSIKGWMGFSEILERRREILPNGRLTVFCELRLDREESAPVLSSEHAGAVEEKVVAEDEASESNSDEDEDEAIIDRKVRKLQKDLKSLLVTGEDSDVTIKVQGKEFPAHRNILRARSPVFRSMFSHEMVEKQSGVVVIEDCDPVTFPDFLKYVYTGSTRHICDENVDQLYTASHKYGIDELKEECAEFMKNNLSVDKFCDTIALAVLHNEEELVEVATAFFCENAREVTKTAKWQVFLHENTTVGNELFIKFLSNAKD